MSIAPHVFSTRSGRLLDLLDDSRDEQDLQLEDLAHALAGTCRYGGHTPVHYSVAEHSVLLCDWFMQQGDFPAATYALFHDAHEAFLGDVPYPALVAWPAIRAAMHEAAAALDARILQRFGVDVDADVRARVKAADVRICLDERGHILRLPYVRWPIDDTDAEPLGVQPQGLSRIGAAAAWLARANALEVRR